MFQRLTTHNRKASNKNKKWKCQQAVLIQSLLTHNNCRWPFGMTTTVHCWRHGVHLCVCAEHMALDLVHGVHPIGYGSQVESPEHHLILGKSPW